MKKFAVVIPAYNASRTVVETINACQRQSSVDGEIEIILVDDGSEQRLEGVAGVRYLYQPHAGPAAARNAGWKAAAAQIVFFTDADCVPEPEWVHKLSARYTAPDIAGVGGSYAIMNPESLLARCIHEEIIVRHSRMPPEVDFLGSFNVSYRRSVLEEVGGFDESFKRASAEDNELAYRIKKKGYRLIFDKTIQVGHYHPSCLLKYLKSQFWHGYWRVHLYLRHPDMTQGDSYAGVLDLAQPPLLLATLCLFPFMFLPGVLLLNAALVCAGFLLQLPLAIGVVKKRRKLEYLCLAGVTFLRGYARGLGMARAALITAGRFAKKKRKER